MKALIERNPMKKIPSKLDEQQNFDVALKITFLPFWAPCISKTVWDRKNWLNNYESSHWEESNDKNPIKIGWKIKPWPGLKNHIFALLGPLYLENGKR